MREKVEFTTSDGHDVSLWWEEKDDAPVIWVQPQGEYTYWTSIPKKDAARIRDWLIAADLGEA